MREIAPTSLPAFCATHPSWLNDAPPPPGRTRRRVPPQTLAPAAPLPCGCPRACPHRSSLTASHRGGWSPSSPPSWPPGAQRPPFSWVPAHQQVAAWRCGAELRFSLGRGRSSRVPSRQLSSTPITAAAIGDRSWAACGGGGGDAGGALSPRARLTQPASPLAGRQKVLGRDPLRTGR